MAFYVLAKRAVDYTQDARMIKLGDRAARMLSALRRRVRV
jgi:hypothetical protein